MKKLMVVFFMLFAVIFFCQDVESARYQEELLSVTNVDLFTK